MSTPDQSIGVVNEDSTFVFRVTFKDTSGNFITPVTISYRIDDVLTVAAIKVLTAVVPTGSQSNITILAAENAILSEANEFEYRRLTSVFTTTDGQTRRDEFIWTIKNLRAI